MRPSEPAGFSALAKTARTLFVAALADAVGTGLGEQQRLVAGGAVKIAGLAPEQDIGPAGNRGKCGLRKGLQVIGGH